MLRRQVLAIILCSVILLVGYGHCEAYNYTLKQESEVVDLGPTVKNLWVKVYLENYGDESTPATTGAQIRLHLWGSNSSQGDLLVNDTNVWIAGVGPHGRRLIYNRMIPITEIFFNNKYSLIVIIGPGYAPIGFVSDVIELRKPIDLASRLQSLQERVEAIYKILKMKLYK